MFKDAKQMIKLKSQLEELGLLYEHRADKETLTEFQQKAIQYHREGYELSEQINDHYAAMGAIMQRRDASFLNQFAFWLTTKMLCFKKMTIKRG